MGGEQAARTMQIVAEAGLARKGLQPDPLQSRAQFEQIDFGDATFHREALASGLRRSVLAGTDVM